MLDCECLETAQMRSVCGQKENYPFSMLSKVFARFPVFAKAMSQTMVEPRNPGANDPLPVA
jgi:hypothetical protein